VKIDKTGGGWLFFLPPVSTSDEDPRQASQDDEFLPSRGVRCQYSPSGEEAKKNSWWLCSYAHRLVAARHHFMGSECHESAPY
jgi:hypothetical protein